jgi:CheY-like chemotaxis protein
MVSNGQEALEEVRTRVYDLILCDLRMPTMDGPAFYGQLRAEHPELVDVGAPLLIKPFPREDLDVILARMIGPTRSRPEAK